MNNGGRAKPREAKIKVRFDQQQRKLLDFLRAEGKFGSDDGEIIPPPPNVLDDLHLAQARAAPAARRGSGARRRVYSS